MRRPGKWPDAERPQHSRLTRFASNSEVHTIDLDDGILRYSTAPLAYLGQSLAGERLTGVTPTAFGAVAGGVGQAIEVDTSGAEIRRFTQLGVNFVDIDAFQGGYLGVLPDRVEQFDANFNSLGEFAADAYLIAQQGGFGYFPDEFNVLSDGRVTIGGVVSVAVVGADGTVLDVHRRLQILAALFFADTLSAKKGAANEDGPHHAGRIRR